MLSSDKAPNDIAELIRQHRASFLSELRQLIVEGQASGQVAAGEPEQLAVAIAATLGALTSCSQTVLAALKGWTLRA